MAEAELFPRRNAASLPCPLTEAGLILNDSAEAEFDGTISMVECQPEWSDQPLLKFDCPQMGYLSYKIRPPCSAGP